MDAQACAKTNGGNPAPALCYLGQVVLQSSLHEHNTDLSVTNLQPLKKKVIEQNVSWIFHSEQCCLVRAAKKATFGIRKEKKSFFGEGGEKEMHINRKPHSSCEPGGGGRAHGNVYTQTYYFLIVYEYTVKIVRQSHLHFANSLSLRADFKLPKMIKHMEGAKKPPFILKRATLTAAE